MYEDGIIVSFCFYLIRVVDFIFLKSIIKSNLNKVDLKISFFTGSVIHKDKNKSFLLLLLLLSFDFFIYILLSWVSVVFYVYRLMSFVFWALTLPDKVKEYRFTMNNIYLSKKEMEDLIKNTGRSVF